jgi:hypothetical protein
MSAKNHGPSVCVPSCVGPIPPLVITKSYFRTKRLLASILQSTYATTSLRQRSSPHVERGGSGGVAGKAKKTWDVHFALFVGYHLNSFPANKKKKTRNSLQPLQDTKRRASAVFHVQFDPVLKAIPREIVRISIESLPVQNLVSLASERNYLSASFPRGTIGTPPEKDERTR